MLGCFNPNLGQIWTNPNVSVKNSIKKYRLQLKVKVEVGLQFEITFLTQHLGLPMIWVKTTQHQVTLSVKFHNY